MKAVRASAIGTDAIGNGAAPSEGPYPMGLMAVLATVTMLFAAFTAALLVRRAGTDWVPVQMPTVVWVNTAVLVLSSGAVEIARRSIRRGPGSRTMIRWLAAAAALGVLFLAGQVVAWNVLAGRGIFLPTSPHASFFYMLTAIHGIHLVGGLAALAWALRQATRGRYTSTRQAGLTHVAIYWHFVDGIWVWLLLMLVTS